MTFPLSSLARLSIPHESPNGSHAFSTPDTAWPVSRFPPRSSRSSSWTPVLMSTTIFDALSKVHLRSSLSFIPDAINVAPFNHDVHHPGHCAGAAHGSLKPPPTRRLRGVIPHLSYSMTLARLLDTKPSLTPAVVVDAPVCAEGKASSRDGVPISVELSDGTRVRTGATAPVMAFCRL